MKNINRIDSFLPESKFSGKHIQELVPADVAINEALGDGSNLDGKTFSEVKVSDWMWDFGIERKSFPQRSVFNELVVPDEYLSVFSAQLVNSFAIQSWKAIKTKKIFSAAITEDERKKIKSKLRGFWGTKRKLETYKQEKESLEQFIKQLEAFLMESKLGESIELDSENMVLSKSADPGAGPIGKIFTTLKSFFSKSGWQKALAWLVTNIANNSQYVKWLNTTIYEPNTITTGITPDVSSAFSSFIIDAGLDADMPNMENAMPSIKLVAKKVIEKSKELPKQGSETWMGALYNTYLFGLYQRMLIIACCAWVYDLIGDTNIMRGEEQVSSQPTPTGGSYDDEGLGLQEDVVKDVRVYRVGYRSPEFKKMLNALVRDKQIGDIKYNDYMKKIEARKDSRSVIRSLRTDILQWGNSHSYSRTDRPKEVAALGTDGSTRVIVPIDMYKKLVG